MATVTVRNLADEVHRALKVRAAQHGRSTEAEIREILEEAAKPKGRVHVGSHLAAIGRRWGLRSDDAGLLERAHALAASGGSE